MTMKILKKVFSSRSLKKFGKTESSKSLQVPTEIITTADGRLHNSSLHNDMSLRRLSSPEEEANSSNNSNNSSSNNNDKGKRVTRYRQRWQSEAESSSSEEEEVSFDDNKHTPASEAIAPSPKRAGARRYSRRSSTGSRRHIGCLVDALKSMP